MTVFNAEMQSGDSLVLAITATDSVTEVAIDLTGATIAYAIGKDGTVSVSKTTADGITVTDAAAGELEVSLDPADTAALAGIYAHELQITDAPGNVSTVMTGTMRIKADLIE